MGGLCLRTIALRKDCARWVGDPVAAYAHIREAFINGKQMGIEDAFWCTDEKLFLES